MQFALNLHWKAAVLMRYGLSDDETVSEDYVKKCEGMCNLGFLHPSNYLSMGEAFAGTSM